MRYKADPFRGPLRLSILVMLVTAGPATLAAGQAEAPADLIFHGGLVWTVDPQQPRAEAVAVAGDKILAVGSDEEVLRLRGPSTEAIDLAGRMLLPGFNDAHMHFQNAAEWNFFIPLYDARTLDEIVERVKVATARVPKGMWITGGDWGAHAAWKAEAEGRPLPPALSLDRVALDAASRDHPLLLKRYDGAYFANSLALDRGRFFTRHTPDPSGGRIERDPETGEATGMLYGRAAERMVQLMPPPSLESTLVGARLALGELARNGITSIGDVARLDELSQRQIFHTHVERSATNLDVFRELQKRGELSVRVYAFPTLGLWKETAELGIRPRTDDGLIRFGALKAFIDGYLMEEPYLDNPDYSGSFTFRFVDPETMERDVVAADRLGFDPVVHTIGDKAHRLLLDWLEAAVRENPPRDRRFRIIHFWYPDAREIERAGRLGAIADITPYHLIRDIGSVERKLGPERSRTAHAWRSLIDAGVRINLVSDWPGSYNEYVRTPVNPLENIYYAVARRRVDGTPAGGWHPDQALTVEEAIEAYTINPAYASYEDDRKGTITIGKLADLVVVSEDIASVPVERIRLTEVDCTVLGGRFVYHGRCRAGGHEEEEHGK